MLLTILTWAAVAISILAASFALYAMFVSRQMYVWLQTNNARSKSLAKITALEGELLELASAIDNVESTLKTVRSKLTMRERRAKANGSAQGVPDPQHDPEGWKAAMRLKLHQGKFGSG